MKKITPLKQIKDGWQKIMYVLKNDSPNFKSFAELSIAKEKLLIFSDTLN
jgi:hypothetical protein|tara:strand:- start:1 stop:150 length:150 start_codon:yes stop_codon:yes gene_type:complete